MLKFKHCVAAAAAAVFLVAGVATAQIPKLGGGTPAPASDEMNVSMVRNATNAYEIGYPTDWKVLNADGVDYVFLSPDNSSFCMVISGPAPDLASVPEDQLRIALSQSFGEQFWTDVFFKDVPNTQYVKTSSMPDHPGGWPVQFVVANGLPVVDGKAMQATFAGIMTFKQATVYMVMCIAPTAKVPEVKAGIGAVVATFRITR
jgi:hypothetical protein